MRIEYRCVFVSRTFNIFQYRDGLAEEIMYFNVASFGSRAWTIIDLKFSIVLIRHFQKHLFKCRANVPYPKSQQYLFAFCEPSSSVIRPEDVFRVHQIDE